MMSSAISMFWSWSFCTIERGTRCHTGTAAMSEPIDSPVTMRTFGDEVGFWHLSDIEAVQFNVCFRSLSRFPSTDKS